MASEKGHDNAPDSWDQESNGASGEGEQSDDLNQQLSNLNVNAPVFVPGLNLHAPEFVPTFGNGTQPGEFVSHESKPGHSI